MAPPKLVLVQGRILNIDQIAMAEWLNETQTVLRLYPALQDPIHCGEMVHYDVTLVEGADKLWNHLCLEFVLAGERVINPAHLVKAKWSADRFLPILELTFGLLAMNNFYPISPPGEALITVPLSPDASKQAWGELESRSFELT